MTLIEYRSAQHADFATQSATFSQAPSEESSLATCIPHGEHVEYIIASIRWDVLYHHITEAFRCAKELDPTALRQELVDPPSLDHGELVSLTSESSMSQTAAGNPCGYFLDLAFTYAMHFFTPASATLCVNLQAAPRPLGVAVRGSVFIELEGVGVDRTSDPGTFNLSACATLEPVTVLRSEEIEPCAYVLRRWHDQPSRLRVCHGRS